MYVTDRYISSDPVPFSLSPDAAALDMANVQAERLDLRLKQTVGNTPYFTPLDSIILVV